MDLIEVIGELREALGTIDGLRVPEWGVQSISPPAALILPPDRIEYGLTYGSTCDRYPDLEVAVLVPNPTTWRAFEALAPYCDGAGDQSVRAAIEGFAYTECDPATVKVTEAKFDTVTYAGTPYLAAIFTVDLTGTS